MRSAALRLVVLGAVVCAAGAVSGRAGGSSGPAARRLPVTGYADEGTSVTVVAAQARAISTLGVAGVDLAGSGSKVTSVTPQARNLLVEAHADRLRCVLLVGNYDTATGTTSTALADRLLRSPRHRSSVVAQLRGIVASQGWDGVTVDLESLDAGAGAGLAAFVAALRRALPASDQVAVDVSATTSPAAYRAEGYELAALARFATVVLMAYDEHGPWGAPGPIGGLPWQRDAIAAALGLVPARRLTLGVAAYGYTWPAAPHRHDGTSVTDAQAHRLVERSRARAKWVAAQGEWTATLHDGTVMWWSDARSYLCRRALALRLGLGGLAVWQLASAAPLPRA